MFIPESMVASWPWPWARSSAIACAFVVPAGSCLPTTPSNRTFVASPRIFGPLTVKATEVTPSVDRDRELDALGPQPGEQPPQRRPGSPWLRSAGAPPPPSASRPVARRCSCGGLLAELGDDDLAVGIAAREQLVVRAHPGDPPVVEHDDPVGVHDRAHPLRHDDDRGVARRLP